MRKIMMDILEAMLIILFGIFSTMEVACQEKSDFFPPIEDWTISENIEIYSPETLYDAINGAADSYLRYGWLRHWW